ncbi:hypothetical protein NLI96_g10271 [Meripilus lineatus]|uniref:DNA replication complex GINS protein PSF1 n=1 Tax=Meripilus lineatus TaxID=2056292 RepID=A0AAD5UTY6_9APHY|nr:hypothetical protein NLI96_g10271 [Physisporinus lineatus]
MDATRQYGELATQLLLESRRSTATDTLLKYNDVLVRTIVREQRQLESLLQSTLEQQEALNPGGDGMGDDALTPTVLLYQTAIIRNKRCLLAYHHHRIERLKELFWGVGGALPLILSTHTNPTGAGNNSAGAASLSNDIRSKLSPHEVDFLRSYSASLMTFRSGVLATEEVDLFIQITRPPKDIHVLVRVVLDCGVIQTELGTIDFKRGQRFLVRAPTLNILSLKGTSKRSSIMTSR